MLRRLTAWSLLILALSPFTAPFRTCDLLLMIASSPAHSVPYDRHGSTIVDHDVNIASVPAVSPRVLRAPLIEVSGVVSTLPESPAGAAVIGVFAARLSRRAQLASILRV